MRAVARAVAEPMADWEVLMAATAAAEVVGWVAAGRVVLVMVRTEVVLARPVVVA